MCLTNYGLFLIENMNIVMVAIVRPCVDHVLIMLGCVMASVFVVCYA